LNTLPPRVHLARADEAIIKISAGHGNHTMLRWGQKADHPAAENEQGVAAQSDVVAAA
jgi:hypothetical protein